MHHNYKESIEDERKAADIEKQIELNRILRQYEIKLKEIQSCKNPFEENNVSEETNMFFRSSDNCPQTSEDISYSENIEQNADDKEDFDSESNNVQQSTEAQPRAVQIVQTIKEKFQARNLCATTTI